MFSDLIEVRNPIQEACKTPREEAKFLDFLCIACLEFELKTRLEFELR